MVATLLTILPDAHHDVPTLRRVLRKADPTTGKITAKYKYSRSRSSGRSYTPAGYQTTTSAVRNICADDNYLDVDIVNCFPSLLYQIIGREGIPAPLLREYVLHREEVIAKTLKAHPTLDRSQLKRAYIVCLHNGNYRKHATEGMQIPALEDFRDELKRVVVLLSKRPSYVSLYAEARDNTSKHNTLGTFVSWVAQDAEAAVIDAAIAHSKTIQYTVGANMFDGLMIEKPDADDDFVCAELTRSVFATTGFDVSFVCKPMVAADPKLSVSYTHLTLPTILLV